MTTIEQIEQKIKDLGYTIQWKKEIKDITYVGTPHSYCSTQSISKRYLQYKLSSTQPPNTQLIKETLLIHFYNNQIKAFKDLDVYTIGDKVHINIYL